MSRLFVFIRTRWVLITVWLFGMISVLSLWPLPQLPEVPGGDKLHHIIAYATLAFPVALRKPRCRVFLLLFFMLYSGMIECAQPYVNRYADWLDLAANVGGILLGVAVATVVNKFFPEQSPHWST